jgi:hypothetical protein
MLLALFLALAELVRHRPALPANGKPVTPVSAKAALAVGGNAAAARPEQDSNQGLA